jgi:hypothetical protein
VPKEAGHGGHAVPINVHPDKYFIQNPSSLQQIGDYRIESALAVPQGPSNVVNLPRPIERNLSAQNLHVSESIRH